MMGAPGQVQVLMKGATPRHIRDAKHDELLEGARIALRLTESGRVVDPNRILALAVAFAVAERDAIRKPAWPVICECGGDLVPGKRFCRDCLATLHGEKRDAG